MVEWLTALQDLPLVAALRASRWSYAAVNASHIVGIALLFGAIVPLDLRLMGFWRSISIKALARILVPVAAAGLLLAIAAGALLFSIRAVQYSGTVLFQIKMALIVCGIGNAVLLRKATQWEAAAHAIAPARSRRLVDCAVVLGDCVRADAGFSGLSSAVTPCRVPAGFCPA
jgi:hypothetical protein